jgi:hypothetical protein
MRSQGCQRRASVSFIFDFGQRDGHADLPPGTMARRAHVDAN